MSDEERRIPISEKAYERLTFARREEGSFSDVIKDTESGAGMVP